MNNNSIKEFVKNAFNLEIEDFKEKEIKDVSKYNVGILSYNFNLEQKEFKRVLKIVRKSNAVTYRFHIKDEKIEVTSDHQFFVKLNKQPSYLLVKDLFILKKNIEILLFNDSGEFIKVDKIEKVKEKQPIFDFEVEDNHNFFTNGYLSHNTMFGSPETTQAGNALKFWASTRLDLRKTLDKEGDDVIGLKTKFKVLKNKTASPYQIATVPIVFGVGFDKIQELIEMADENEIIKVWGKSVTFEETKYTLEDFKELLQTNEEFFNDIREKTIEKILHPEIKIKEEPIMEITT